ncbi:glycosyltransferase family 39 protein [Candidatus Saccharibacteria bacterium]|nr:glycosyltransferase family 39 protein [Candidatus Saccharibacteria bacterium]
MKDFLMRHKRAICILAPACLGLLYMILCFVNMRQSIWFDESFSVYITRFDFAKMWSLTAEDVHPPLFYIILKIWAHFFGRTDFALRSLATIFGAVTILFVFLLVKYKYGKRAAILSSFLLSISPIFIRYGEEMRMYTLMTAIIFAATYFMHLAIDNRKRKWWVIYGILVALGMWTHYFTALAWLAHLIYLLRIFGKKFFSQKIFLCYVLAIVLYLPWIPSLLTQFHAVQGGFWIGEVSAGTLMDYWTEATLYQKAYKTNNWCLILSILESVMVLAVFIKTHKKAKLLSLLALVPVGTLVLLSMPPLKPMFVSRYVICSMICAAALIPGVASVCLMNSTNSKRKQKKFAKQKKYALAFGALSSVIVCSVVGISTLYTGGNVNLSNGRRPSARELYEAVAELDNELPIVCSGTELYYDMAFYSGTQNKVYFTHDVVDDYSMGSLHPLRDTYFGRINDKEAFINEHERIWYVSNEKTEEEPAPFGDSYRVSNYYDLQVYNNGDKYRVYLFERAKS